MTRVIWALMIGLLLAPASARAQDVAIYYHTDAIGSVRMITDENGAELARYDFMPFGERMGTVPTADPIMFAGKERDDDTKLDYFGARYLRSGSGRFTTVDPEIAWPSVLQNPQLWNRYAYALNNPLRFIDPDGRCVPYFCIPEGYAVYVGTAAAVTTAAWLVSPQGKQAVTQVVNDTGAMITYAVGTIGSWFQTESQAPAGLLPERAGPVGHISPGEVAGRTPAEIDARARELGLAPKGPSPSEGRGSYVDPLTGEQRILSHPNDPRGPHGHVNDPAGNRIGPDGRVVPGASPDAHLPIRIPKDESEREFP